MLADPKIGALGEQQQQQQQQQRRSVPKRATDRRWEIPFSWRGGPVRSWRGRTPELRKHLWLELRCKAGRAPGDYYACESVFTRGGSSTVSSCARTPNHDQNTLGWNIRGSEGGAEPAADCQSSDWSDWIVLCTIPSSDFSWMAFHWSPSLPESAGPNLAPNVQVFTEELGGEHLKAQSVEFGKAFCFV